jgi:hypothetical protein
LEKGSDLCQLSSTASEKGLSSPVQQLAELSPQGSVKNRRSVVVNNQVAAYNVSSSRQGRLEESPAAEDRVGWG